MAVARNTNYTRDTTLVKAKWCRVCTTFTLADYKDFVAVLVLPAIVFSQRGRANFWTSSSVISLMKTLCCIHVGRRSLHWCLARWHCCQSLDRLLHHWLALGCCLFKQVSSVNFKLQDFCKLLLGQVKSRKLHILWATVVCIQSNTAVALTTSFLTLSDVPSFLLSVKITVLVLLSMKLAVHALIWCWSIGLVDKEWKQS